MAVLMGDLDGRTTQVSLRHLQHYARTSRLPERAQHGSPWILTHVPAVPATMRCDLRTAARRQQGSTWTLGSVCYALQLYSSCSSGVLDPSGHLSTDFFYITSSYSPICGIPCMQALLKQEW